MPQPPTAFFLTVKTGQRLCIFYPAQGNVLRGQVLYIHPFAEEMNKSRRMARLQAQALAQAGFSVLQIDLLGCGDSSGDFGDATWQAWVDDVMQATHWLRQQDPGTGQPPPLWLWGLRAGCLLAVDAARHLPIPCHFLFWQAPAAGKPLLQQFLRLKMAGELLGGQSKGVMDALRQQLASGTAVEIAGYALSPDLAAGLEQATLTPPAKPSPGQQVVWLELSTRDNPTLSPIATQTVAKWQNAGYTCSSHVVSGPAYWQTTEIEDAPALITASTAALSKPATPLA
jgi:exosortase A-associated hydrolase 2